MPPHRAGADSAQKYRTPDCRPYAVQTRGLRPHFDFEIEGSSTIHGHAAIVLTLPSPFFTIVIFTTASIQPNETRFTAASTCSLRWRARRRSRGRPPSSSPCCRSSWWSWFSWRRLLGAPGAPTRI